MLNITAIATTCQELETKIHAMRKSIRMEQSPFIYRQLHDAIQDTSQSLHVLIRNIEELQELDRTLHTKPSTIPAK